jgi:hypothetical protein
VSNPNLKNTIKCVSLAVYFLIKNRKANACLEIFDEKSHPLTVNTRCASSDQGCQMVYFKTKNYNLGKFWRTLEWKMLKYVMAIWNILLTLGICYDHLVQFVDLVHFRVLV